MNTYDEQLLHYYFGKYQKGRLTLDKFYEKTNTIIKRGEAMKTKTEQLEQHRQEIEDEIDVLSQEIDRLKKILRGIDELEAANER
jgi:uncharacterized coiled-coil DUF342 family protein